MTTDLTADEALNQAIEAHKAGNLKQAEGLYRAILQTQPMHPNANHNLGVIADYSGKTEQALPLFKTALEANPYQGQFWISLINALIKEKQFRDAMIVLEQGKSLGLTGEVIENLDVQLASISLNQANSNQEINPSQLEVKFLMGYYQRGQLDIAEKLAKKLTQKYPKHQFAWKLLGIIWMQTGNLKESLGANQRSVEISPNDAEAYYNLGITLKGLGRLEDAEVNFKKAVEFDPDFVQAHSNLGATLQEVGKLEDAVASYKKAIKLKPDYAQAYSNMGNTLQELGRLEEAEASYKKAIELIPNYDQAHYNLGNTLQELGRLKAAEASYKKAIEINPDFVQAHINLGITLQELDRPEEAEAGYKKAISINPYFAQAYYNLGVLYLESDKVSAALDEVIRSIKIEPTFKSKKLFIEITKKIKIGDWDHLLSQWVITALLEPWGSPLELMQIAIRLLTVDTKFMQTLDQLRENTSHAIDDKNFINSIFEKEFDSSSLLLAMLSSCPIPDVQLEVFFTNLRCHLLKEALSIVSQADEVNEVTALHCHLAQQCFINEYVYFQKPEETELSQKLRDRLTQAIESEQKIPAVWIIATACYFPLYSVAGAHKILQKNWSTYVNPILKQQIQEPFEELNLRRSIPALTSIDNQVSLEVQRQYEENPYPRWVGLPKDSSKKNLNSYIQSAFPLTALRHFGDDKNPEVLIAGCGTGQHPIGTSQSIKGARILAVDLSLSSLTYAKRKTIELGIESIQYAQADLLQLASIEKTFDLIESSGVLHHLGDPFEGWRVLISLLKPNGLMRLGLYSELARRDIIRVRSLICKNGIGSTSQDIRDYRKQLVGLQTSEEYGFATGSSDFFSTSACRDLLFHVQEHRMNMNILADFFKDHNLNLLGFEVDRSVIQAYRNRFSNDPSAINLKQWHIYEEENPDTFLGMYHFWVQKNIN
ncbi:MAG: tetratricopeptide repeat protein [Burkholderiaceae bacterium]